MTNVCVYNDMCAKRLHRVIDKTTQDETETEQKPKPVHDTVMEEIL